MNESHIGLEDLAEAGSGMSRRDALRKGALVIGATAWATPVVQTIGPGAWAMGSTDQLICGGDGPRGCRISSLTLQYTGNSCASSNNTQSGKAGCTDKNPQSGAVKIWIVSKSFSVLFRQPVSPGGTFTINNPGTDVLFAIARKTSSSTTYAKCLKDVQLLQYGFFNTSCSKPISVGDQFGALKIVGYALTGCQAGETPESPNPGGGGH